MKGELVMNKLVYGIKHLTKEDMKKIMEINPEKLIVWCGAGISAQKPTNLPLGKTLVDFILSQLLDKQFVEELYEKLNCVDEVIERRGLYIGNCLRLESVVSEIFQIEHLLKPGNQKHLSFSESFGRILEAPYNLNHELIAYLVSRGSTVVTTNYDVCIQKAVRAIDCHVEFSASKGIDGIYEYGSNNEKYGRIFHIHGTAEEPKNIGITYQTVSRNFSKKFEKKIDTWLEEDYTFVFLGYSCSDNYDVERYFEELYYRNIAVKANAVYIQHGEMHNQKDLNKSIEKYLSFFKDSYTITMDTSAFLKNLVSSYGYTNFSFCNQGEQFQWEMKLKDKIKISEEMRGLVFLRICRLIGMNPIIFQFNSKMENFNRMVNMKQYPVEDYFIELTRIYISKEQWDVDVCKDIVKSNSEEYNENYNNTRFYSSRLAYDMNDIYEMERDFDTLIRNLPILDTINNEILIQQSKDERIGWEISTPLHKHTKILWYKMKNEVSREQGFCLSKKNRLIAKKQLECINKILKLDFEKFEEINQYCVALRSRAMLIVFLFGEDRYESVMKDLSMAVDIYIKESSIEGVAACLLLYTTIYFLLYLQTKKYYYLLCSLKSLNDVCEIASICQSGKLKQYILEEKNWQSNCLESKGVLNE